MNSQLTERARYRVRIQHAGGRIEEVRSVAGCPQAISLARKLHAEMGRRTWVLDAQTREIIHEIEPREAAGLRARRAA
jgi:hypothetical protein